MTDIGEVPEVEHVIILFRRKNYLQAAKIDKTAQFTFISPNVGTGEVCRNISAS